MTTILLEAGSVLSPRFKTKSMITNKSNPRKATEAEWDQLVEYELAELEETIRVVGHSSVDYGDLAYMLDHSSLVVFDDYNTDNPAPGLYAGKLMILVWGLRNISEYVWQDGKLIRISEENRAEFR